MSKISAYGALSSPADDDVLPVVDVSDTTMASTGTTKKIAVSDLLAGAGTGTVTAVSVASANGFAGTVANDTSTPAVTVETTITGLLKGNGTAVSAASAGTDYLAPAGDGSALTGLTESQVSGLTADLAAKAPLASPALSGSPTAPTQTAGDDSTKIATTAYADAAAAAGLHPWQFRPEDYGALGDGKVIADLVLNGTTTATSATAAFTSGDTGKYVMVNGGAGTGAGPLLTTITYVDATTVTLADTASVSGSAFPAVYGTDDTAAINSAIGAAKTYALANGFYGEILFSPKIYILGSGPTQTTSPAVQNSQLQIPFPNVDGSTQKLVLALTGTGDGHVQYWESTTPNVSGTALVSMTTAPSSPDGTYGNQSVLGGPSGGGVFTGGYANTKAIVTGISIWSGAYTNQYAFDFAYLGGVYMRQCSAHIFAAPGVGGGKSPLIKDLVADSNFQNKIGAGMRTPVTGNNADCVVDSFTSEGYSRALYVYDHLTASRIFAFYSDVALKIDTGLGAGGVEHLISIANFGCEQFNGGISTTGSGGPFVPVSINMDAEVASPAYDISDAGNILHGQIQWDDTTRTDPAVTGASNVKIVNASRGPGVWSGAPSVPATTVAATNTAYRDATVYITSGGAAVTEIDVDATATGLTLGTSGAVAVRVPAGHSITLTYASTAPTWAWVLE